MVERTIGKLASAAGVNVETVRYYQRRGLIDCPSADNGFRKYSDRDVERLRSIRRAKELGFTLEEIRDLLSLAEGKHGGRSEVKALAEARAATVRAKINDLLRVEEALKKLTAACSGRGPAKGCPIIEALNVPDGTEEE
jgi:Hg(II)-responsive transcriptional regulator